MRNILVLLTLMFAGMLGTGLRAEDNKDVTLKGTILCTKCSTKEKDIETITTDIQVKEAGKTVTYYLLGKGLRRTITRRYAVARRGRGPRPGR